LYFVEGKTNITDLKGNPIKQGKRLRFVDVPNQKIMPLCDSLKKI